MKRLAIIGALSLTACDQAGISVRDWHIIGKVHIYNDGIKVGPTCKFYFDLDNRTFIDSCNKYSVGDTIKH